MASLFVVTIVSPAMSALKSEPHILVPSTVPVLIPTLLVLLLVAVFVSLVHVLLGSSCLYKVLL